MQPVGVPPTCRRDGGDAQHDVPGRLQCTLRLARERRRLLYWSYDSLDYQRRPPAELVAAMRARPPRPGDVMLMHDDGDCCIGMLETLLPQWRSEGFEFRALPTGADVDATVEGARA